MLATVETVSPPLACCFLAASQIFDESLRATWRAAEEQGLAFFPDVPLLQCRELVFAEAAPSWDSKLVESSRPAGMNTIGMVRPEGS